MRDSFSIAEPAQFGDARIHGCRGEEEHLVLLRLAPRLGFEFLVRQFAGNRRRCGGRGSCRRDDELKSDGMIADNDLAAFDDLEIWRGFFRAGLTCLFLSEDWDRWHQNDQEKQTRFQMPCVGGAQA